VPKCGHGVLQIRQGGFEGRPSGTFVFAVIDQGDRVLIYALMQ
jgi:hypothetical protein